MANQFLDWMHKKLQQDVVAPVERDVVQPIGHHAIAQPAAPLPKPPAPTPPPAMHPPMPPQPHASVMHDLTHNDVTDLAGSIVKPLAQTGEAVTQGIGNAELKLAGRKTQNAQQYFGKGINDVTGYTGTKRQIAGAGINTALTALAPGVDKGIESVGEKVVPKIVANVTPKIVGKVISGGITGGIIGGPFNVGSDIENGKKLTVKGEVQSFKQGAEGGAVLGAAAPLAGEAASHLFNSLKALPRAQRVGKIATASASKPLKRIPVASLQKTDISGYGDLDRATVEKYKNQIQNTGKVKPILAMQGEDGKLYTEDGKHRAQAARELGIKTIPGKVVTPTDIQKIAQGGYANVPWLEPGERKIDPISQEYGVEYPSDEIVRQAADGAYQMDKSLPGGNKFKAEANGSPVMSGKSPFFRNFRDENAKSPTKSDYVKEVTRQLKDGGGDIVDQGQADAYHIAKERESSMTAGVNDASADLGNAPSDISTQGEPNDSDKTPASTPNSQVSSQPKATTEAPNGLDPNFDPITHEATKGRYTGAEDFEKRGGALLTGKGAQLEARARGLQGKITSNPDNLKLQRSLVAQRDEMYARAAKYTQTGRDIQDGRVDLKTIYNKVHDEGQPANSRAVPSSEPTLHDNVEQRIAQENPLAPKEPALVPPEENTASSKPQNAGISDAEWNSIMQRGAPEPTNVDRVVANGTGEAPETIAAKNAKRAMYQQADSKAFTFLEKGGNRNSAMDLYRQETGATEKMAKHRLNIIQRTLNNQSHPGSLNPVRVDLPEIAPGDYAGARLLPQLATNPVHVLRGQVVNSLRKLNPAEKAKFADLVEHPEDIERKGASDDLRTAISRYRDLANRIHATSQALGGKTPFRGNYFHHDVDLSDPKEAERYMAMVHKPGINTRGPLDFTGLDTMPRVFKDIRSLHAHDFKLKHEDDPIKQVNEYVQGAMGGLRRQALTTGFTDADQLEAEAGGNRHNFDLHNGQTIPLSDRGMKEIKGYERDDISNLPVLKGIRKVEGKAKGALLSASQYHPVNVNLLQAAPTLAAKGHPIMAAKGALDTFLSLNKNYADRLVDKALKDGTIEAAAHIGTPIKFGSDYETSGKLDTNGAVFDRQIPAMHIQMVRAALNDLNKHKVSLDSTEARNLGNVVNSVMGFVNTEARNLDPRLQHALSDFVLAPQFERSKLTVLRNVLSRGQAGSYARRAVFGKYAAEAALAIGVGTALGSHQSIASRLANSVLNPSIPTGMKDSRGNNIMYKLPDSGASELLSLGLSPTRNGKGQFRYNVTPGAIPGNLETDARNKLAPLFGSAVKLATNTDYADKPLSQKNAPAGTRAIQDATTLGSDLAPIGLQGSLYLPDVTKHLPGTMQTILNANKPGSNAFLKMGLSSVAMTPETDKTTGKGLQTNQYYNILDNATRTLVPGSQAMGAFLENFGVTKDPVTGQYLMTPDSEMTVARSASLNAYPAAANAANQMAKQLIKDGQKVDPYYLLTPAQQKAYNAYETMAPLSADRTDWQNRNPWYSNFANAQTKYFNSLPPADPNKPKNPIQYPNFSKQTTNDMNTYFATTDSTAKNAFLDAHPDVGQALNQQFNYSNAIRVARGYQPLKGYPQPSPQLQSELTTYDTLSKADAKTYAAAHPEIYNFFDQASIYDLNKDAGVNQIQGNNITPAEVKKINSLGEDIYYDGGLPGDNGQLVAPTGSTGAAAGSSSGGYTPSPAYVQLHSMLSQRAPSIEKLATVRHYGGTVKSAKSKPIIIAHSTISKSKRPTVSKRKAIA